MVVNYLAITLGQTMRNTMKTTPGRPLQLESGLDQNTRYPTDPNLLRDFTSCSVRECTYRAAAFELNRRETSVRRSPILQATRCRLHSP